MNASLSKPLSAIRYSGSCSSTIASAATMSWVWPGVSFNSTGLPKASTATLSFVLKPPRERPKAWSPAFFFRPGRMLVGPDHRRIQDQPFQVRFLQRCHNGLPNSFAAPPIKTLIDIVPLTEALGQISPGNAGARHIKNRVEKQPILLGFNRGTRLSRLARKQIPNSFPLFIRDFVTMTHGGPP